MALGWMILKVILGILEERKVPSDQESPPGIRPGGDAQIAVV